MPLERMSRRSPSAGRRNLEAWRHGTSPRRGAWFGWSDDEGGPVSNRAAPDRDAREVMPMTPSADNYAKEVSDAIAHTESYGRSPEFRRYWLGFTEESRNFRAQQTRVLGELLGRIAGTLEGWRILDVGCGDGRWLRALVELDARPEDVVGIDVSDARFDIGRAKNESVKLLKTDGV